MTRQSNSHGPLGAVSLPMHDAGRLMALSVANSALMDGDDDSVVELGLDDSASLGRSSPLDPKHCASPGIGTTIWSVQSDIHGTGAWSTGAVPVVYPVPGGRGGHRKAASVGVPADSYLSMQPDGHRTAPLDVTMARIPPPPYGSTTSLPTSPTESGASLVFFDGVPSAHLLSRSVSPPRSGKLSARAAPFQSQRGHYLQFGAQSPPQPPAPTPRQMQLRQQARPHLPQHRATAPVRQAPRRPSHTRSRSDLVVTSMATRPALPVVHETMTPLNLEDSTVVPPPRCVTPQPFQRPSSTADGAMPEGWFAAWAPGPGKRLPSLAEIAAKLQERGKLPPTSPPRSATKAVSPLSSPDTIKASTVSRNKRYSIESESSTTSSMDASDSHYASSISSSTSADDPSLPVTPFKSPSCKSRLPPFLLHRRTDSSSTMSSGSQSPSLMTSFREAARSAALTSSPEKVHATPTCPAVRITPPIDTASMPEPRFTITPPSAGGHKQSPTQIVELKGVPQIMCTPASATRSWISLNDDEDKVQCADVPAADASQPTQREEKSRVMLSKLKRRSLELKA